MEPVTTIDGYKVLQNPNEARDLLGAYYESLGFHVIKTLEDASAHKEDSKKADNPR